MDSEEYYEKLNIPVDEDFVEKVRGKQTDLVASKTLQLGTRLNLCNLAAEFEDQMLISCQEEIQKHYRDKESYTKSARGIAEILIPSLPSEEKSKKIYH